MTFISPPPSASEEACRSTAQSSGGTAVCVKISNLLENGYTAILEQHAPSSAAAAADAVDSDPPRYRIAVMANQVRYYTLPKNTTFTIYEQGYNPDTEEEETNEIRGAYTVASAFVDLKVFPREETFNEYGCKRVPLLFLAVASTLLYAVMMSLLSAQNAAIRQRACFDARISTVEQCSAYLAAQEEAGRLPLVATAPAQFLGGLLVAGLWFLWAYTQGPLNPNPTCQECLDRGNHWRFVAPEDDLGKRMCKSFQRCECRSTGFEQECKNLGGGYAWSTSLASASKDGYHCACCKPGSAQCVDLTTGGKPCTPAP